VPYYATAVGYFYLNLYLLEHFWKGRTILVALMIIGINITLYFLLLTALAHWLAYILHDTTLLDTPIKRSISNGRNLYRSIYLMEISIAYWLARRLIHQIKENHQLRIGKLEQEIAYLRAQANPHLAFNILNTVQADIRQTQPETAQILALLADDMLYAYTAPERDGKVPLEKEIAHIQHYFELQQLRLRVPLYIDWHIDVKPQEDDIWRIPQLILHTLLENMFKYGILTHPDYPAEIKLICIDGLLHLHTENKKVQHTPFESRYATGLSNVRSRLQYYYPGNFTLTTCDEDNYFILELLVHL